MASPSTYFGVGAPTPTTTYFPPPPGRPNLPLPSSNNTPDLQSTPPRTPDSILVLYHGLKSQPLEDAELDEALDMASDSLVPDCIRHLAIDWATQRLEYLGFLLDKHLQRENSQILA
ncbi:hypothetical protein BKA81DRAFT_381975 [Phyllosticta paracitricarpa]